MRKALLIFLLVLTVIIASTMLWFKITDRQLPEQAVIDLSAWLADNNQDFSRPDSSWRFSFPEDFVAHADFRTESWYFSGHLVTSKGRRFGFQLVFFRLALAPKPPPIESAWATNQVYRAHFAITDVAENQFYAFERYSRAALRLSGSELKPARVWLEDWIADVPATADETPRFRLHAAQDEVRLDIDLASVKPVVLPGDSGFFGNNTDFHSFLLTRLAARGIIQIGRDRYAVEGLAGLDRVWGAVPLPRGQIAFNRFFLQLDNGQEIVILQIHRRDGNRDPTTDTGLVIDSDGSVHGLDRREIMVEVLDNWKSPRDGIRYPARWRLRVPAQKTDLEIVPLLSDQEMNFSVRYWGGAVRVDGTIDGRPVSGDGGVELTGYDAS